MSNHHIKILQFIWYRNKPSHFTVSLQHLAINEKEYNSPNNCHVNFFQVESENSIKTWSIPTRPCCSCSKAIFLSASLEVTAPTSVEVLKQLYFTAFFYDRLLYVRTACILIFFEFIFGTTTRSSFF